MMSSAVLIGCVVTLFGSALSLNYDLPPGATIVLCLASLFIFTLILKHGKQLAKNPFH